MDQCWVHHTLQTAQWQHTTGNEYTLRYECGSWGHCTVASTIIYCCTSQQCYSQLVSHSQSMYISSSFNPMFSLTFTEGYWHSLTSVSSLTALFLLFFFLLTVVVNHEPPQAHQVLYTSWTSLWVPPSGSSATWGSSGFLFHKSNFCPQMKVQDLCEWRRSSSRRRYQRRFWIPSCKGPFLSSLPRVTGHIGAFQVLPMVFITMEAVPG